MMQRLQTVRVVMKIISLTVTHPVKELYQLHFQMTLAQAPSRGFLNHRLEPQMSTHIKSLPFTAIAIVTSASFPGRAGKYELNYFDWCPGEHVYILR